MNRYRRAATFLMIGYFCVGTLVLISEHALIPPEKWLEYAIVKELLLLTALPLAYWLYRDVESRTANLLVGINLMAYCIQGQMYRPLYYYALLQLGCAYAFLFPVSRLMYRTVVGTGAVLFLVVFYLRWDFYVEAMKTPSFSDIVLCVAAMLLISFACNNYFNADRTAQQDFEARFTQIGIHSARVVHDLKGLISSPRIYAEHLKNQFAHLGDSRSTEAFEFLIRDLNAMKETLSELNKLSVLSSAQEEWVGVLDAVSSVQLLLHNQLSGIAVEARCDPTVKINFPRATLISLILNLLLNAANTCRLRNVEEPKILVSLQDSTLSIQDNGGGFLSKQLAAIPAGEFNSSEPDGSGLGLLFVYEEVRKRGGKVNLENGALGALVKITFPSKLFA